MRKVWVFIEENYRQILKESYINQLLAQWTYNLNGKFKIKVAKVNVHFRTLYVTKPPFTCSKLTKETPELGVKYVQS